MGDKSKIEWTDASWNPTTGCDRVSEGCQACYALDLAARLKAMGNPKYQTDGEPPSSGPGFGLALHPDTLELPLRWRRPRRIFVDSMSDLFHAGVPDDYIAQVFGVMGASPRHRFQVLTKRPGRMASLLNREAFVLKVRAEVHRQKWQVPSAAAQLLPRLAPWPLPNVLIGTSVEDQRWAQVRIPNLVRTPAAARFLSCEPLLGEVNFRWMHHVPWGDKPGDHTDELDALRGNDRVAGIDWVIVGGESGPKHRPMDLEWARLIRDQCQQAGVPFFFKQVGGRTPKSGGRELDGRTWDEMPDALRLPR